MNTQSNHSESRTGNARRSPPRIRRGLVAAVVLYSAAAAGAPTVSDDSITIYSRLQPGAVSPDLYRPAAGRTGGGLSGSAVSGS